MRMGGPVPFNQANSFPVSLGPGGYFYPPAGQYLMTLGNQTLLQWWDPVNSDWRNLAPAGAPTFAITIDGYNYRLLNCSGVVQGAAITNAGSGGTNGIGPTQTGSTITIAAPGGNGQQAKGYVIVGGAVGTAGGAATVTQAGSAFVVPPLILIDPPPLGGIQATATAQITSAGLLSSVTMVNPGAGYLTVPNFYVVPQFLDYPGQLALPYTQPASGPVAPNAPLGQIAIGPGGAGLGSAAGAIPQNFMQGLQASFPFTAGALVTGPALTGSGTLTGIVITDYGSLYNTTVPAVTFGGTSLGAVAATAIMSWAVQSATETAGAGFVVGEAIQSSMGYFFSGTTAFRYMNNDLLQPRFMTGVLTNANGTFSIEDPGFGIQTVLTSPNLGVQYNAAAAPTAAATWTIVMGGITDTSILQASIND